MTSSKDVQEVCSSVENTQYCHYFEQAENGLYTRMAILGLVIGAIDSYDFPKPSIMSEPTNFMEVKIHQKTGTEKNIADIKNGLLIDHLPKGSSDYVIQIMGYQDINNVFTGRNVKSVKYGRKDIIKIESNDFDLKDLEPLNKLALVCPTATINLIKNGIIVRKGHVRLPSVITDLVICPNGDCVTRPEYFETDTTMFYVLNRSPLKLECHYCGHEFGSDRITIKKP